MKITSKQYATALYESVKDKSEKDAAAVVGEFVKTLSDTGALSRADTIVEEFSALWNKEAGIVEAEITSVADLDRETLKEVEAYLRQVSKARNVLVSERKDPSLLGGAVIRYGDKIVDGSLRGRLSVLKERMKK